MSWLKARHFAGNKHKPKPPVDFPILWGSDTAGPQPGEDTTIQWLCDVYEGNRHVAIVLWEKEGEWGMGYCSEKLNPDHYDAFWRQDLGRPGPRWRGTHRTYEGHQGDYNSTTCWDLWGSISNNGDSDRLKQAYTAAFNEGLRRLGFSSRM